MFKRIANNRRLCIRAPKHSQPFFPINLKADAEIKCHRSKKSIKKGDDIITVPGLGQTYLEEHFTCFNCGERLAADNYFEYEDEVYCGRCHAEKFMPRCSGCDELIFDPTYTVAENRKWHTMHFCCWVCDIDLCEKQYAKDKDANPVCLPCYNEKYAPTCSTCNKPVAAGARAMKVGEQTYCHNAECFKCKACDKALEGEKCIAHEGALMCSPCYRKTHSPPCARCDKQIRGEFVEVRGKRYCKTCFTCGKCTKAFTREEKGGAYPVGDDLLCYECALETRRAEIRAKKKAAQAAEEAAAAEAAAAEAAKSAADAAAAEAAAQKAAEEAAAVRESEATMLKDLNNQKTDAIESGGSEAKANEGGFVRQGTRKVTRLSKKMPPKSKSSASVANSTPVPAEIEEDGGGDDEVEASGITEEDVRTPITQEKEVDPFAALWAGFSIPKKLSKFSLDIPGREILDTGGFFLIEKKFTAKVFLVLATDVIFLVQMVDESLYELMMMPELRNKVKAKVSKLKDAVAMDVKIGSKTYTLKCANETERAIWCGKLNAPIGFITTKALQ